MSAKLVLQRRREERASLLATARGYVDEVARAAPLQAAVVFGSVARGDFNLWSDLDLLLLLPQVEGRPHERLDPLPPPPPRVQPIVWSVAEWQLQRARRNPIAVEAVERGAWLRGTAESIR